MGIAFAFVLSLSVAYDIREGTIPNALTVGGLCAALGLRVALEPASVGVGIIGAGLGLLIALPLFAFGIFGAGDGKLLGDRGSLSRSRGPARSRAGYGPLWWSSIRGLGVPEGGSTTSAPPSP